MELVWTLCVLGMWGGGQGFEWWMYHIRICTGIKLAEVIIQDFIKKNG